MMLSHYRDGAGHEVDLILETPSGEVAAAEIKATRAPNTSQLDHLSWLRARLDRVSPGAFRGGFCCALVTSTARSEIGFICVRSDACGRTSGRFAVLVGV